MTSFLDWLGFKLIRWGFSILRDEAIIAFEREVIKKNATAYVEEIARIAGSGATDGEKDEAIKTAARKFVLG